eukprot:2543534-Heterocapsa_arctica.AAC.1
MHPGILHPLRRALAEEEHASDELGPEARPDPHQEADSRNRERAPLGSVRFRGITGHPSSSSLGAAG